jgi:hypothetical protein
MDSTEKLFFLFVTWILIALDLGKNLMNTISLNLHNFEQNRPEIHDQEYKP